MPWWLAEAALAQSKSELERRTATRRVAVAPEITGFVPTRGYPRHTHEGAFAPTDVDQDLTKPVGHGERAAVACDRRGAPQDPHRSEAGPEGPAHPVG